MCINSSLTTLGNCIYKLTEDPIPKHIPYRESKLTQLLHDSLGGNSKTALLICCSPSSTNYAESISTLRFGQRAKRMRNHATVNIIKSVVQYERESKEIKKEIMKLLKILEMCAYDVHKGLLGQLTIENCTSYVKLLELKRNFVSDGGGRNAFQNMANMIKNSSSNFLNLFPSVLKLRREIASQNKVIVLFVCVLHIVCYTHYVYSSCTCILMYFSFICFSFFIAIIHCCDWKTNS